MTWNFRVSAVLLSLCLSVSLARATTPQSDSTLTNRVAADSLKSQVQDLFASVQRNDKKKISRGLGSLAIPNHKEWFLNTFGPAEGSRLEARYSELGSQTTNWLKERIEDSLKEGRTNIESHQLNPPLDSKMPLLTMLREAMVQPTTIFQCSSTRGAGDKSPYFLGYFVYIDGEFRYLDGLVMQALSKAPTMRIMLGMHEQKGKLLKKVQANYPKSAREQRVQGVVKLAVILGLDGSVQEMKLVTGDPLLVSAALDAVKQWRYEPTFFNGQPVEVDTEIYVIFTLAPGR